MNKDLSTYPIHLGRLASAQFEPAFTGTQWYTQYETRHVEDGSEGRLLSMFTFDESWSSWEMHPVGAEVVICTSGVLTMIQEIDGRVVETILRAGEAAINPAGVWHTADVSGPTTAIFITPGMGTQQRAR